MLNHWKKFIFFDSKYIGQQPSQSGSMLRSSSVSTVQQLDPSQIASISDIQSLKFVVNILGVFYVGIPSGKIYCSVGDSIKSVTPAYSKSLLYLAKSNRHQLILTIGVDQIDASSKVLIKMWEVTNPEIPRQISGFPLSENFATSATAFVVNDDLTRLAIGLKTGQILVITGNLLSRNPAKRILNLGQRKAPLTNLFFLEKYPGCYLFYTTMISVGSFFLKDKNEMHLLLQQDGCAAQCADLDQQNARLVVGLTEFGTLSVFYPEFKGQSWFSEGVKLIIRCYKNQVIVVSAKKNQQQVGIYDIDNQYSGFMSTYTMIDQIIQQEDGPYIISRNNKKDVIIQKLTEKSIDSKLSILFKKNNYEIAYKLAKNEGFQDSFIADISRMQGDHYYMKGDFDNAIIYYKQTVGFLQASYVIIKFLDPSKIEYLKTYLEHLHNKHQHTNQHTALLLNCYVHLKDTQGLNNFLGKGDEDLQLFDAKTAIDVCCEARCYNLALTLAKKHSMHSVYVKILIDEEKNYRKALRYMQNKMSVCGFAKAIKEHGKTLMEYCKEPTQDLVNQIIGQINFKMDMNAYLPEDEKDEKVKQTYQQEFFLDQKPAFTTLTYHQVLEHVLSGLQTEPEAVNEFLSSIIRKTPDVDSFIYHKLFELYLVQRKNAKNQHILKSGIPSSPKTSLSSKFYQQKIKEAINEFHLRYDKHHVLMLLKMYEYPQGVAQLCLIMDNKAELMSHYIQNRQVQNIWNMCEKYGTQYEGNILVQALTFFSKQEDKRSLDYIQRILQIIENQEFLTPLIVLEILNKNRKITFGVVKQYLKSQLQKYCKSKQSDQRDFRENLNNINTKKKQITDLKTQAQKFLIQKCATCDDKLYLPSIHFMCGHSYHQHCLTDSERDCQLCAELTLRALERRDELEFQSQHHGQLFNELRVNEDRFSTIAMYFGRGLFSN